MITHSRNATTTQTTLRMTHPIPERTELDLDTTVHALHIILRFINAANEKVDKLNKDSETRELTEDEVKEAVDVHESSVTFRIVARELARLCKMHQDEEKETATRTEAAKKGEEPEDPIVATYEDAVHTQM